MMRSILLAIMGMALLAFGGLIILIAVDSFLFEVFVRNEPLHRVFFKSLSVGCAVFMTGYIGILIARLKI